jgi:hypothetical protein
MTATTDTLPDLVTSPAGTVYEIRDNSNDLRTHFDVYRDGEFITTHKARMYCLFDIENGYADQINPAEEARTMRPTPARRVARSLERLVWTHAKSGAQLDHGRAMTAAEAVQFLRVGAANADEFRASETRVSFRSGFGTRITYDGTLPVPADPHAAVDDLVLDLRLDIRQGDLFRAALEAAADGGDPRPALLQLLATTAVR